MSVFLGAYIVQATFRALEADFSCLPYEVGRCQLPELVLHGDTLQKGQTSRNHTKKLKQRR